MLSDPDGGPPARSRLGLFALAVLLTGGVVAALGISARQSDAARLQQRAQAQAEPVVTLISPSAPAGPPPVLDLPGRIEAQSRALVHARVAGYLRRWHADIGTPVKAGQLLAEIDTPELDQQLLQARAELASARANAALSEATARRWQTLQSQNFVSAQAVEEKSGDVAVKQAQASAVQANLDRLLALKGFARVAAPFDGVVTARSTDIGALVNPGGAAGTELFVVSDVARVRLYVTVPQNQVPAVKAGDAVSFSVPERPGQRFDARVLALSQAIGAGTGGMVVQLAADNRQAGLLPGGFASVRFSLPPREGVLVIPPSALLFGKAGPRVAVVNADHQVMLKPVTIARDLGASVEIATGLDASDRLIESPPDGIADGAKVKPRPPAARPPAPAKS